jgi:hypothetical protein
MVIRPNDVIKPKLSKKEEKSIDAHLRSGGRTYSVSGMKYEIIQEIIEKYKNAGWKVKSVLDQRDGDFLQFVE